jgi:hypothetical protein
MIFKCLNFNGNFEKLNKKLQNYTKQENNAFVLIKSKALHFVEKIIRNEKPFVNL